MILSSSLILSLATVFPLVAASGRFSLPVVAVETKDLKRRQGSGDYAVGLNAMFHIPVQIGTPPQNFLMLPDSGAGAMAVKSVYLPANETGGAPTYNPANSSTAVQLNGYTYSNCYASGHCGHGQVWNDTISVGNLTHTLSFEISTGNNGVGNSPTGNSGDFGLAYSKGGMGSKPKSVPTWFQSSIPLLEKPLFVMDFNKAQSKGTIDFGYIDPSKYVGEIGYAPLNAESLWAFNFTGFAVGNGPLNNQGWGAVLDSGTSVGGVPQFVVDGYFANVPGATKDASRKTYSFPCSTKLPDFVLGINTYRGVIPGSYIKGSSIGNGQCTSQLIAGGNIIGQNFIPAQLVIFDYGNKRLGLANKVATSSSTSPSASSSLSSSAPPSTSSSASSSILTLESAPSSTVISISVPTGSLASSPSTTIPESAPSFSPMSSGSSASASSSTFATSTTSSGNTAPTLSSGACLVKRAAVLSGSVGMAISVALL